MTIGICGVLSGLAAGIPAGAFWRVPDAAIHAAEEMRFSPEAIEYFEKQVRPVLAESCWECHGPKKQEAGLRLDSRAAVLRGGDSGAVVAAGNPESSRLMAAVERVGDLKMPPATALPGTAVDALRRWIGMGLPWPESAEPADARPRDHWAFQSLRTADAPDVREEACRGMIDSHVREKQRPLGLSLSQPASLRTLARRISFDLLGLPPDPDQIATLEGTEAPDAIERFVDQQLCSPALGERWARHWLDVARYADNKGYVFFEEKNYPWAYAYRDYVIEALNRDLPFDQFVLEQLAADQLPAGADPRSLRALGFLTLGAHFMNNVHDIVDDRIDVVTRGLMGLTVSCARCHDHKYDPIPQADYYSLYGVFRGCEEPLVAPLFDPPPQSDEYRAFEVELATREGKLNEFVQRKHRELLDGGRTRVAEYLQAVYASRHQPATDDFMIIADTTDVNPAMIKRWRNALERAEHNQDPIWYPWHRLAAVEPSRLAEFSPPIIAEIIAAPRERVHRLVRKRFESQTVVTDMKSVTELYGELFANVERTWKQRLAESTQQGQPPPVSLEDDDTESLRRVLYGPTAPPDVPPVFGWGFLDLLPDRASQGEYQKLLKEVESWLMTGAGAPARSMPLLDAANPFEPRIFQRGNPLKPGDAVPRQFLAVANPRRSPFQRGSGRLEMAWEVVHPDNPLTARVIVNRVWLWHFGQGLVRTPSDFGLRSQPPSHPELLDQLADQFRNRAGWSWKWLHRQLVLSATYQQDSAEHPKLATVDPENRWLSRMNARRLEFEALRDSLLSVSDQFDRRIGGPPVPIFGDTIVPRRTLYGFIDRMDVSPLLTTFDFPNPSQSSPQRESTTVAPQSLYLMNNGMLLGIAEQVLRRPELGDDTDQHIDRLFQLLFSRPVRDSERSIAREFLGVDPDPLAWKQLVHALLLSNEFAFVD